MNNARDTIEQYRALLQERKSSWKEKYSPDIAEALEVESSSIADGLEKILLEPEFLPGNAFLSRMKAKKAQLALAKLNNTDAQFYLDPRYADLHMDRRKLSHMRKDELAIFTYVLRCTYYTARGSRRYHHTASSSDIREVLFHYWKTHEPDRLKYLIKRTIHSAQDRGGQYYYGMKCLEHKSFQDIRFEDLEEKNYLSYDLSGNSPFRTAVNRFVRDMVHKKMLIVTPGYVHTAISIPRKYLRK